MSTPDKPERPADETRHDLPILYPAPPPPPPPPPPGWSDYYSRPLPPPPGNYYPPLPPPSPQLPDFKPHRMSMLDKVLAWIMAFVILVFGMVLAAHFLLKPAAGTPAPHTSPTSSTHHASTKAKTTSACPPPST